MIWGQAYGSYIIAERAGDNKLSSERSGGVGGN